MMATAKEVTLSFHDLQYEVSEQEGCSPFCGKAKKKVILHGVSGLLPPGLNAILGPTGSGKTSLIDILAQRKDPTGLVKGTVLLNGQAPPGDFRLMSGYVVQDDVVMGTLTVRENLAFSANLRLSAKKFDTKARKKKVEEVIEQLGLQACADTKVGNEFVRGVSGGERKRVNLGMEMILDPPILFLDEPTTGLDSNTANSIILLLHKLSTGGRNIIMSVHQPRYSIFSLFDQLILLDKGEMVYRGPCETAVDFFAGIGYRCPKFHNPADFFLDIIGGDSSTAQLIDRMNDDTENKTADKSSDVSKIDVGQTTITMECSQQRVGDGRKLIESFGNSEMAQEESKTLTSIHQEFCQTVTGKFGSSANTHGHEVNYANGFFHQMKVVSQRTLRDVFRNPQTSIAQIMTMIVFAVLIDLLYFQSDTSFKTGVQNRAGVFFFITSTQVMSNLSALRIFIENRKFFVHESASGYYRASVYFIAQVIADLLFNRIAPNVVFSAIVYFAVGFQLDVTKYFFFLLAIVLTSVCASSIAFFVSASVRLFAVANVAVSLPYILMMLFGGFLVNTGSLLDWVEWIKYVSIFRYGINALTVNEMSGLVFIDNSSYPGFNASSSQPCISTLTMQPIPNCTTGEIYMEVQGIPSGVWGQWQNIIALGAMATVFIALSYVQLRRIKKFK